MRNNYDYGDYGDPDWKQKQVTWQKPQVWTCDGYKFYMYQSSNGFLNWRCLKAFRPDGSKLDNMSYKTNIGQDAESVKSFLRKKVEFDLLASEEKDRITKAHNERPIF